MLCEIATGHDFVYLINELHQAGKPLVYWYFFVFYGMSTFILVNIFVAVVLENFELNQQQQSFEIKKPHCESFKQIFNTIASNGISGQLSHQACSASDAIVITKELRYPWVQIQDIPNWENRLMMEMKVGLSDNRDETVVTYKTLLSALFVLYLRSDSLPFEMRRKRFLMLYKSHQDLSQRIIAQNWRTWCRLKVPPREWVNPNTGRALDMTTEKGKHTYRSALKTMHRWCMDHMHRKNAVFMSEKRQASVQPPVTGWMTLKETDDDDDDADDDDAEPAAAAAAGGGSPRAEGKASSRMASGLKSVLQRIANLGGFRGEQDEIYWFRLMHGVLMYSETEGGKPIGAFNIWGAAVTEQEGSFSSHALAQLHGETDIDGDGEADSALKAIQIELNAPEEEERVLVLEAPWGDAEWLSYRDEWNSSHASWEQTTREWEDVRGEDGHYGFWLKALTAGAAEPHWQPREPGKRHHRLSRFTSKTQLATSVDTNTSNPMQQAGLGGAAGVNIKIRNPLMIAEEDDEESEDDGE
eukprot:SAG22_NODE_756_length_7442_cov_2.044668_2_plen_527_part_00